MAKMDKETRIANFEIRKDEQDESKMILEGYAVVFDSETLLGTNESGQEVYETIERSAFENADMNDVPMKYNHSDTNLILARTRNKSLQLNIDEKGLFIRAELLDTVTNRDIYKMVQAGLLDKMSFAFTVPESGQKYERDGNVIKRHIIGINRLWDVSVVDVPAYDDTSIYARSLKMVDTILSESSVDTNDSNADAEQIAERQKQFDLIKLQIKILSEKRRRNKFHDNIRKTK